MTHLGKASIWTAAITIVGLLLAFNFAHAGPEWLAWHDDMRSGNPAISYNAAGNVAVVMPEAMLADASTAGLDTVGAVAAFLARHAPGMCSDLVDMNKPHPGLPVMVFVQRHIAIPGMIPGIRDAYMVDRKSVSVTIDYAPAKPARCIEPEQPTS